MKQKITWPILMLTLILFLGGIFQSAQAQTNPGIPFNLASGSWTLAGWSATAGAGNYPINGATGTNATTGVVSGAANANMVFWRTGTQDPTLTSTPANDYSTAYNGSSGARMNGQGANGFSFINTGTSGNLGMAVLSLKTTNRTNINVAWTGRTISITDGSRIYRIRAQYRVGNTGSWSEINASPVEYTSSTAGNSATFSNVLPAACDNQALVQVRWFYYSVSGTGTRPGVGVDDITVSSDAIPTTPVINSSTTASATTGTSFSYTITATNSPTSYNATNLPPGLTVNTTTGAITGIPTTYGSGTYNTTISATNAAAETGTATLVFTISKGTPVITFANLADKLSTDADYTVTATSTSSVSPITYTSSNTAVATISGNTVHITGAGSTDITASQAANADFNAAVSVTRTQVVANAALTNQTITFGTLSPVTYGDASFTLNATASSDLQVTYTSTNTAVATVSGNTVTIVAPGTTNILANQAGNGSYNAAPEVSQALTVDPKNLTVSGAAVITKAYDGTDAATLTGATLVGVVGSDDVTVSGNGTFTSVNAGTSIPVTAALVLGGTNASYYTLSQPVLTGNIDKADQVLAFGTIPAKSTIDADFSPGATSATSAVNPITYSSSNTAVATIVNDMVHIVGVGTTVITATQAANENYNTASADQTLNVIEAKFTIGRLVVARVGSGSAALNNAATPIYLDEYNTDGTTGFSLPLPTATSGNTTRILESGSATSEGQLNLSADGQYLTLGGYDATPGLAGVNSAASINRVVARVNSNAAVATTVLTSTTHGSGFRSVVTSDGSRYWTGGNGVGITSVAHQGNTTVATPTTISTTSTNIRTVSIFNGNLYYTTGSGGTAGLYQVGTGLPVTTGQTSVNKILNTDAYAYQMINRGGSNWNCYLAAATATPPGIYKYVSTDNGATWTALGTVTITGGAFSIAAKENAGAIDVYATTGSTIVKFSDTAAFDATITGTPVTFATAGTNKAFRGIAFAPGVIAPVITNAALSVNADLNTAFTYTITANNSATSYDVTGLPDGVTINTTTGVITGAPEHAGTFNVTISATNSAGSDTKTLVINVAKGNQTINFAALPDKQTGDADFALTATSATSAINPITYTSSNTAVATVTGNTVHIVGAGLTTITAQQAGNADYNAAADVPQDLHVTSATLTDQTITFDTLPAKVYGDAPFNLTATSTSGLTVTYSSSNTAVATVSGNTVTIVGVGTTSITASQSGDSTYNPAAPVIQSLEVTAKQLTINGAAVTTKVYDGNTTATVTGATLNGIVGTDVVSLVSGTHNFDTATAGTDKTVTTNFSLTGADAVKYTLLQPALTGTISKANQTITFNAYPVKSNLEASFAGGASSATAGVIPITYQSSNENVAVVSGTNIQIVGAGTTTITASQAENDNYNAATSVIQVLTVQSAVYLNQFTGASACPTNGNIATTASNASGTPLTRNTITCNSTGNVFNSTTLNNTAAVNNASYIEFSVSAAPGSKMNLTSLSFFRQASNSAPNQLAVRYSTDGFATYTEWASAPLSSPTGTVATWNFDDFNTTLGGTVTFRLYPYGAQRADLTGTSSVSGTFRLDDITVFGTAYPGSVTWNGNSWSNGTGPDALIDAAIEGAYNTATNGAFTANNVTVASTGTVTVATGTNLTVVNTLANNNTATGSFVVENDANLVQGNAVTTNTNTGNIRVNRDAKMWRQDYIYWGSPVTGQNLRNFSPATLDTRFYMMDEPTNGFKPVFTAAGLNESALTYEFVTGKGYMVRAPNTFPNPTAQGAAPTTTFNGVFNGVPNNGNVTVPVSNSGPGLGFNMLSNPYPSALSGTSFLTTNPGTLYFWVHHDQVSGNNVNYATFNLTGQTTAPAYAGAVTPDGSVAIGQGFVYLNSDSQAQATFTNAMRTGNNSAVFYREGNEKSRIWINLSKGDFKLSQALVAYIPGTTTGFDASYDGKLMEGGAAISSLIGDDKYAIQARAEFTATDIVPMHFTASEAGNYSLSIDNTDGIFAGSQDVYLKDNVLDTLTDLKANAYSFASEAGSFANRFQLVYQASPLANPVFETNKVVVFKENNVFSINSGNIDMAKVQIFDMRGRMIYTKQNINANTTRLNDLKAEQGVLLVQITSTDGTTVTRKVVY